MISSQEVSALVAQQQQQMAATLDYSYQTSMGLAGGIGSYGRSNSPMMPPMGMPPPAMGAGVPYGGANQAGFAYRPQGGYGLGSQGGMAFMGGVNSTASLASTGLSLATMGSAYAGARAAGSGVIRSAIGGAMAFGPGMVLGSALEYAGTQMHAGAQEQQAVYGALGQNSNFINSSSRSGRGFSRQDGKAISDFTREMQAVPEMMTSMSELTRIMGTISAQGAMHGARSASEFQKKFKENINTLKEISKVMQTSMEESIQFMNQSKAAGFHTSAGQILNTAQRQFTSGITGMNQQQIQQLQMSGSQMSFQTGGRRRSGANAALRTARQVGMANEMGILGEDTLREVTGLEGADAIGALSETLTGAAYSMSRGGLGTAMSIAVGAQDKSGRFTGEVDDNMVERIRSGGISKGELLSLARKKTSSRGSKMSFAGQRGKLRSEMASAVGVEGITMELQGLLGDRGFNNPDAQKLVMERFGVDERTAGVIQTLTKNMGDIQGGIGGSAQTEARRQGEQAYLAGNNWEAMKTKLGKKIENKISEPLKKVGADMSHSVETYIDDFMDGLMDRYSVEVTRGTAKLVSGAMSGGTSSQQKLADMAASSGNVVSGNTLKKAHSSMKDSVMGMMGTRSKNLDDYEFLEGLKGKGKDYVSETGGTLFQSEAKQNRTKGLFNDLSAGKFSKSTMGFFHDKENANFLEGFQDSFKGIMEEHNVDLSKMSQTERLRFIKEKMVAEDPSHQLQGAIDKGITFEEQVAYAQRHTGTENYKGSLDFKKYSAERFGQGTFESAGVLAGAQKASGSALASKFGDQESNVNALLQKDSKERELFLAASKGDKDAMRLLKENVPPDERDKLLSKYGVTEDQVESTSKMFGGAKGANVKEEAEAHSRDIARSSLAGEAVELRRSGKEILTRMDKMGKRGGTGPKTAIESLGDDLAGLTDSEKMVKLVGPGGRMSGDIRNALDSIDGMKGNEREQNLDMLGPGARTAMSAGQHARQLLKRKGGVDTLRNEGDEDVKSFIDQRKGKLGKGDQDELVKMIRDRKFAGSLAPNGNVLGKDVGDTAKLAGELTKFVDANSKYVQTNANFAQAVYGIIPGAKKAAEQLGQAGANVKKEVPEKK